MKNKVYKQKIIIVKLGKNKTFLRPPHTVGNPPIKKYSLKRPLSKNCALDKPARFP